MTDTPAPTPTPTPTPSPAPTPTPAPSLLERGQGGGPDDGGAQSPSSDGGAQLPEWMGGLPDDLKADATLARFKSVEELGRGHIEAHKLAKSKVVLPKEGDADAFGRFAAAIRPEKPEDYAFTVPEGQDSSLADAMRPIFHQAGLHPESAKILVDGWNAHLAQVSEAAAQKGKDELSAVEAEMGQTQFAQGKQAAVNMLNRLGLPSSFEDDMARFIGGGNTLRLLFDMAGRMGELGRVDPTDIKISTGAMTPGEAMNEARRMIQNKAIAPKLAEAGSAEKKRYDELIRIGSQRT